MPQLTEIKVTYSVGCKANIGNYESADAHLSEGETWDVSGMEVPDVERFAQDRYERLRAQLGARIENEYKELKA